MKEKAPLKKVNRAIGKRLLSPLLSPYDRFFLEAVQGLEVRGFFNAHCHLDRADAIFEKYLRHIFTSPMRMSILPLKAKQDAAGDYHRGIAYTEEDLRRRMTSALKRLISYGTSSVCSCIDVASDIGEGGLLAIRVALELKEKFKGNIDFKVAPNPIFGFKEGTDRWEIFQEAAKIADFLSALPEKDDFSNLKDRDGKIGFNNHLRKVLDLGCELGKEVHFHLDQANNPDERGTETLIESLKWLDRPIIQNHKGPSIWAIHCISPSGYSEDRFKRLIDGLLETNVGVIVCPTAAISMRQLRPINSPIHNSIARVLELCKSGVPVRIGTDNICDLFVPGSDGDMLTEMKVLGHAIRLSTPHILAKLATGFPLNNVDRSTIGEALYQDRKAFQNIDFDWTPAVD